MLFYNYFLGKQLPYSPHQAGPRHFKCGLKMGIFGLVDEGTNQSSIFLIHEQDTEIVGKGANAVISYLYHILITNETYKDAQVISLQADNCVGQNKNNFVMGFLSWYSSICNAESISINFMVACHGKFSPDRSFGVISNKFNKSNVDCLEDFVEIVDECTNLNAIPTSYPEKDINNVNLIDFKSFLKDNFIVKPIKNITQYHSFEFKKQYPGSVFLKMWSDSDQIEHKFLKDKTSVSLTEIPSNYHFKREPMDFKRKLYLYDELRPFIHDEHKKDLFITHPDKILPSSSPSMDNLVQSPSQGSPMDHSMIQSPSQGSPMDHSMIQSLSQESPMDLSKSDSSLLQNESSSNTETSLISLQSSTLDSSTDNSMFNFDGDSNISTLSSEISSSQVSKKKEASKLRHNKSSKLRCLKCSGCLKWISFKNNKIKKCRNCIHCNKYKRLCIQFYCNNL